jgi:putative transposase
VLNLSRSVFRYQGQTPKASEIAKELLALADQKLRWDFGKMLAYLKRASHGRNHMRVRRVVWELLPDLRVKSRKRFPKCISQHLVQPTSANQRWSLNFMRDSLVSG